MVTVWGGGDGYVRLSTVRSCVRVCVCVCLNVIVVRNVGNGNLLMFAIRRRLPSESFRSVRYVRSADKILP